jgi:hypothetical protein
MSVFTHFKDPAILGYCDPPPHSVTRQCWCNLRQGIMKTINGVVSSGMMLTRGFGNRRLTLTHDGGHTHRQSLIVVVEIFRYAVTSISFRTKHTDVHPLYVKACFAVI